MLGRGPKALLLGAGVLAVLAVGVRTERVKAQDAPGGVTSVQVSAEGQQIYEQICQACHMADARGGGDAGAKILPLADNPRLADPKYPIAILLKGRGGMPWFSDMLTPAQMAAVLTYVRSHFNKYPDPVTEAQVQALVKDPPPVPDCKCTQ